MSLGLIIEGIPLTGKTTLLKRVEVHLNTFNESSKLIYHEDLTQRVLEIDYNKGFLDKKANITLLKDITHHISQLNQLIERRMLTSPLIFILERFHITHAAYYPYLTWDDVEPFDKTLEQLNTKLVLLTIDKTTFKERLSERANTGFMSYIKRYGNDLDTILDHYMKSQDQYIELINKSRLNAKVLDSAKLNQISIYEHTINYWLKDL